MITINDFSIINNGQQLSIDVETNVGETITSILLWDMKSFKDYSLATNLDYKLEQTSETETFIIDAAELSISKFEDIWFIEIQSSYEDPNIDCISCDAPALGITYNLQKYYRCMLNYLLESQINECINCNDIFSNNITLTINLLLESIEIAIELGFYLQAIDMTKKVQNLCNIGNCSGCQTVECSSCSKFKQN